MRSVPPRRAASSTSSVGSSIPVTTRQDSCRKRGRARPGEHEDDVRLFDELVEAVVSDFALEECEPGAGLPRPVSPAENERLKT